LRDARFEVGLQRQEGWGGGVGGRVKGGGRRGGSGRRVKGDLFASVDLGGDEGLDCLSEDPLFGEGPFAWRPVGASVLDGADFEGSA
jgi:hypothetical protein